MTRRIVLIGVVALLIAACGPATGEDTTTTSPPTTEANQPVETTDAPEVETDGILLAYSLEAGTTYEYEVDFNQHLEMTATGDPSALDGEELPGEAVIDMAGTTTFMHTVSDGPEPGTYEIHITGEFGDFTVSGTVDGETINEEVPEFAEMEPIDVTVVVDDQGNLIHEGEVLGDPFGAAFGDLGSLGNGAPGLDPGQFIGPPFSDQEVALGDTWSDQIEFPGMGEDPITTTIESTITGTDQVDGVEVFVIETSTATSPIELDLGEFFMGLFGAFIPEDATDEELAEFEAAMGELRFVISIDDTASNSTTYFDADAGIARRYNLSSGANIGMDLAMPDETTGELVSFEMNMAMEQEIQYRLISGPVA